MFPRVALLPGIIVLAFAVPPAVAQDDIAPPAHVSWVEGQVIIERDAVREDLSGPTPLLPGERVRTDGGRAEVLFGDGTLLQLDDRTTIDVLSESLVRLLEGRLMLVVGSGGAGRVQVDTPGGSVHAQTAGEYRLTVFEEGGVPMLELATIRGSAEVYTNEGATTVVAGQRAWAREGELPSHPAPFNSARWDAFDRWSQERLAARRGVQSVRHVPATLHGYAGVLDTHGYWAHQPSYGYVWFPRVAHGWRPYYHGRWRFYARFGWTWLGADVWSWPTHHYGRWGVTSAGAWFWIPGRHWGPAWVHWAVAPGYVSWCPLGFDNRPVFAFWRPGHPSWAHRRWAAWTVVPRQHFGGYVHVSRHALDGRYFSSRGAAPVFAEQRRAPDRSFAVAREAFVPEPRVAVRRGTSAPPAAAAVSGDRPSSRRAAVPVGSANRAAAADAAQPAPGIRTAPSNRRAGTSSADAPATRRVPPRPFSDREPDAPSASPSSDANVRTAVPRSGRLPEAVSPGASAASGSPAPGVRTAAPRRGISSPPAPGSTPDREAPVRRIGPSRSTAPPAATRQPPAPADSGAPDVTPPRQAVPRSGGSSRMWSPDQVPVHRGTAPEPSRRTVAPEGRPPTPAGAPPSYRTPRTSGDPASRRAGPPAYTPAPRSDDGASRAGAPPAYAGPRRGAPPSAAPSPRATDGGGRVATPRGGGRSDSSGGSRGTPPPAAAAPPASGPPPSAAPARSGGGRQAPDGRGSGRAVPRAGGGSR